MTKSGTDRSEQPEVWVSVRDSFPAAHRIRIDTQGTLEPVHVHHWRVEVCFRAPADGAEAAASRAREALRAWVARYRGRSLNDVAPYDRVNPTAEEVARAVAREFERDPGVHVARVTVGEAAGFSALTWPHPGERGEPSEP